MQFTNTKLNSGALRYLGEQLVAVAGSSFRQRVAVRGDHTGARATTGDSREALHNSDLGGIGSRDTGLEQYMSLLHGA